jgi:hypothetical protein
MMKEHRTEPTHNHMELVEPARIGGMHQSTHLLVVTLSAGMQLLWEPDGGCTGSRDTPTNAGEPTITSK